MKLNNLPRTKKGWHSNPYINEYLHKYFENEEAYQYALNPCKPHSGRLLNDCEKAVEFLLENKEKSIVIMGDFDADGTCSTSILCLALRKIFSDVTYMIPSREKDGYGMNKKMIDNALIARKPEEVIIVTCDNGISCFDAIEHAKALGCTVIVTDHHTIGDKLPEADYIVHPALGNYPFASISGAEVAYKFASVFLEEAEIKDKDLEEYLLQLATLTIVSDVMPVASFKAEEMKVNENRYLLKKGLESFHNKPNWHFKIFEKLANISLETMDETTIGFSISPTINAVGRLYEATPVVDFFVQEDENIAYADCSFMIYLNNERKKIKDVELKIASENIQGSKCQLSFTDSLTKGLIGILAGQIANETGLPSGVFTKSEFEGQDAWTGSMRSASIHLFDALNEIAKSVDIAAFGGHAGAAGITVLDKHKDEFIHAFDNYCTNHDVKVVDNSLTIRDFEQVMKMAEELKNLKPLGEGLPRPTVNFVFYCDRLDLYFKSNHAKISNYKKNELWLFGKAQELLDSHHPVFDALPLKACNEKKKIQEGMSAEEAHNTRWEVYQQFKKYYLFNLTGELDYSTFMGETGPQITIRNIQK